MGVRTKQLVRWFAPILSAPLLVSAWAAGARAQTPPGTLAIVTSYASSAIEPVRAAFEARHPDVRLKIANRKTSAAVAAILDPSREPVDVFWASSPDAFEALRKAGRLERLPPAYPRDWRIGGFPVDDPHGFYAGFAISGFGFVWSASALEAAGAPAPVSIAALADPTYRGLLAMTTPSRSGTTHLMVESVLQRQGWAEGWRTWSAIAGNLATISARSFSVASGVAHGRFAIGLSIDFVGRAQGGQDPLRFDYPQDGLFLPASVGVVAGTRARAAAEAFVGFLMSDEGQTILQTPAVGRLPVAPAAHARLADDLYARAAQRPSGFDAALSGGRYELVNILFDEAITHRASALQTQWARLHAAARRAGDGERARLDEARRLLGAVPVDEEESRDPDYLGDLMRVTWGATPPLRQAALVASWRAALAADLARATELLDEIEADAERAR